MEPLVSIGDVRQMLNVGRTRATQIVEHPTFPEPIGSTRAGRIWRRADVERWIAEHRPPLDTEEG